MATALTTQEGIAQMLKCPLCLKTFKKPKLLPCGHTYCATCLQLHINEVTRAETIHTSFCCPVCTANIVPKDNKVDSSQWIESFPLNSMLASLLEITMEKKGRQFCNTCLKRNRQRRAACYCEDCSRSMCDICKEYHEDLSACTPQSIVSLYKENEAKCFKPSLALLDMCPKDQDERVNFICMDHNVWCCKTCGFLEHRKCDTIITLDNILKGFDFETKRTELEESLQKLKIHLQNIITALRKNDDTIQSDKTAVLKEVQSLMGQLNKILKKLERDLKASIEEAYKSAKVRLQAQERKGNALLTTVHSDLTELDLLMTQGSETQKVIALQNLDQRQKRYLEAISEYQESVKEVRLTLDVDVHFRNWLDDVSMLGKKSVTRSKIDSPLSQMKPTIQTEPQMEVESVMPMTSLFKMENTLPHVSKRKKNPNRISLEDRNVVKVSQFCVHTKRDEHVCHISDIIQLRDSRLLLVDKMNKKIKIFGQDYRCQDGIVFSEGPWNACTVSDTEIAVTVPHQRAIQIICVTRGIQKVRQITTKLQCWGIAYLNDQFVVTTWTNGNSILVLDLMGTEIRKIEPGKFQGGRLSCPSSVTTNRTKTIVYVTYHGGHALVAYNLSWDVLFTYTDQSMRGPGGVDTDRDENIYVCSYFSNNVQQISADGKLIRTLLSGQPKSLRIRFCRDLSRFYLTHRDTNIVEVYDFE